MAYVAIERLPRSRQESMACSAVGTRSLGHGASLSAREREKGDSAERDSALIAVRSSITLEDKLAPLYKRGVMRRIACRIAWRPAQVGSADYLGRGDGKSLSRAHISTSHGALSHALRQLARLAITGAKQQPAQCERWSRACDSQGTRAKGPPAHFSD